MGLIHSSTVKNNQTDTQSITAVENPISTQTQSSQTEVPDIFYEMIIYIEQILNSKEVREYIETQQIDITTAQQIDEYLFGTGNTFDGCFWRKAFNYPCKG